MLVLRMIEEHFHRDVEGRPLREGRTPKELLRPGDIEFRPCPHAGTRYMNERPMNISALRQTSAHWDAVIDALAFLREAYGAARGGYHPELMQIWRVGQIASALPWYFILRENKPLPAYVAALAKITLGAGIWAQREFVRMLIERQLVPAFTAQQIVDTAESNGTLISEDEVCPASDKMMIKFFSVLTDEPLPVSGKGEVGHLLEVRDELLRFGSHYTAFKQWIWNYWLARRQLFRDVKQVLGALPDERELMNRTGEPYDFFVLELEADMPIAARGPWFQTLAMLIEAFSPDRSDVEWRGHALQLAHIMANEPPHVDELAAEVARVRGLDADASERLGRAIATYVALDALHGDVLAAVERGFRGEQAAVFDAGMRDRVLRDPPRQLFASFAPETFARVARP